MPIPETVKDRIRERDQVVVVQRRVPVDLGRGSNDGSVLVGKRSSGARSLRVVTQSRE